MLEKQELQPIYDKTITSYFGEAYIVYKDNEKILHSYGQKVAIIDGLHVLVLHCHTNGQLRHIIEFLKQNHFEAGFTDSKQKILERYGKKYA